MQLLNEIESGADPALAINRIRKTRYHLLSYQAENYQAAAQFERAEKLLQEANRIAESMDDREVAIKNVLRQAAFALTRGNHDQVSEPLRAGIRWAKQKKLSDLEWRAHYLMGQWQRERGSPSDALGYYQQAIQIIESLNTYKHEDELRISFLAERYDPYRDIVELSAGALQNAKDAFNYLERSKAKILLARLVNEMAKMKVWAEDLSVDTSQVLRLIQKSLPEDLIILEYFTGREAARVFLVSAHTFHCVTLPADPNWIAARTHDFLDHLKNRRLEESRRIGQELYRVLILPLKPYLKRYSTLCIVPDEALAYLPFSALRTDKGRFLIEDYQLTQSPSATILKWHLRHNRGDVNGKARKVLVSVLDENLPEAKAEAETIYESYKPFATYLRQPDRQDLSGRVPYFDILHFAGHARLYKDRSAALVLASAKSSGRPTTRSAGGPAQGIDSARLLRSEDVMHWNLPRVRLVSLSACGTSLGRYWNGEGAVGLPYAFLSVGVPSLLVSLWDVDDAATRVLMERFYANLQTDDMSKAEALRQAQISMIKSEERYQVPYYWAPFVLIGDPR